MPEIIVYLDIIIKADSAEKAYDGTPLTAPGYSVQNMPDGYTCTAVVSGSQTDVGTGDNIIESYTITDSNGEAYAGPQRVITKNGTLTVTPCPVTFNLGGTSLDVNGNWALTPPSMNGTMGQQMPGDNTFTLPDGKSVTLSVNSNILDSSGQVVELNTGETYNITYSYTLPEPTSNYDVSVTNTQYTITGEKRKRNVVVNCNLGTVPYKEWEIPYPTVTCDGHSCSSVSSSEFNDFILPKNDVLRISLSGVPELDAEPGTYNITCIMCT